MINDGPEFSDEYRIVWRNFRSMCVGDVRNYTVDGKGYRRIRILLDDDLMRRIKMRFLAASWGDNGLEIHVSTSFMKLPRVVREAGIWHEVGRIHYEHHSQRENCDQAQLRASRISAVENGDVISFEKQADHFAVMQLGKEAVIRFLEYTLHTRPTSGKLGWNDIGKRELELRIAAIRDF